MNNSVVELLSAIRVRPEIFLGEKSLSLLFAFVNGWMYRDNYNADNERVLSSFQNWIQIRYCVSSSQSWANIIKFYSSSDYKALDLFFNLFDEFLNEEGLKS